MGYQDIEWGEDNIAAIRKGWVLNASTVKGLASKIKDHVDNRELIDSEILTETVTTYNQYCAKGNEDQFGSDLRNMAPLQTPPFYAIPLYPGGPNTKGGIMTNAKREVLNWDNKPIPNLFAAGEISSAFKSVYQGGGNLAKYIIFGRIAGRNAASSAVK